MSFDFKMPIGTPILAADDGRVLVVVDQFKDNIDSGPNEAHYVGVEHSGNTGDSSYPHLHFFAQQLVEE